MAGTANASWWQYSRWVWIIARTLRLNPPSTAERSAMEAFMTSVVAGRPWLVAKIYHDSTTGKGYDFSTESDYNLARMVGVAGRDLKKIPLTDAEKDYVDTLIAATGNRRYGDKGNLI